MPVNPKTQAYLNEMKVPTVAGPEVILTGLSNIPEVVSVIGQQHSILLQMLRSAEIAETDEELQGLFEKLRQRHGAMMRYHDELGRFTSDAAMAVRDLGRLEAEIRAVAAEKGYIV